MSVCFLDFIRSIGDKVDPPWGEYDINQMIPYVDERGPPKKVETGLLEIREAILDAEFVLLRNFARQI